MNFLPIIALYIIVIFHIAYVPIKANPSNSDDDEEPLLGGKDLDRTNSVRKKSKTRSSKLHSRRWSHISHSDNSVRRPSLDYQRCALNIKSYLGNLKIHSSLYSTVWSGFKYIDVVHNVYRDYIRRIILHINLLRMLHGACPLQESITLDELAQISAKTFSKNNLAKIRYEGYGVSKDYVHCFRLADVVERLYSTRIFYSYNRKYGKKLAKQFTQLIWRSTTQIGIGISKWRDHFHVVIIYYPKGNIEGHYGNNVFEKKISWKEMAKIK
uniref:SCP domain-containing protein n=1 Tax=Strongyloides papillosus TaxID=174720 RepID=A0A0N5C4H0_STREA